MDIREMIPAYVAGKLDAESKRQMDDYLARHPETEGLTAHWSAIARGLREGGENLLTEHPDTGVLSRFARSAKQHEEKDSQRTEIAAENVGITSDFLGQVDLTSGCGVSGSGNRA